MASLKKYFTLMEKHPELFFTPNEDGVIRIITDPIKIKTLHTKLRNDYKAAGNRTDWIELGVLSEDPWFWVIRDLVEFPDGKIGGYLRVINRKSLDGGTNVVIMATQAKSVLLLKHFRHETRSWQWELPRGFGEPGLSPEQNAINELSEETSLFPNKLTEIGKIGSVDGDTIFYLAELESGDPIKPKSEAIQRIELISLDDFENWIYSGKIIDQFTIMAFLMYKNQ